MQIQQKHSKEKALQKIKHFCAYQERSHKETKEKLYSFGLRKIDTESLLSFLIEENYLNEERYAVHFAGGRFRLKHWGRVKIAYELKQKQVSPYNIKRALLSISEEEYLQMLQKVAAQKWELLKEETFLLRKSKLVQYLLQKGYEQPLIQQTLKDISTDKA